MPADEALTVAVLGQDAHGFISALSPALEGLLPGSAARVHWRACAGAEEARMACLCWLLVGEDPPSGNLSGATHERALRQSLLEKQISYQVLRGPASERISQALQSLAPWLPGLAALLPATGVSSRRPGSWQCENCSDPACEHRLFTDLLKSR